MRFWRLLRAEVADLLLDTCTFLWLIWRSKELSQTAIDQVEDPQANVFLSTVSSWEISLKYDLGKLDLPGDPHAVIPRSCEALAVDTLPLTQEPTLHLTKLPQIHSDPFDRMLVAQAIVAGMTLLTPDPDIQKYPVVTLW